MKPTIFDYAAPTALGEVLAILADRGLEAKMLAGGQSLIPMLNLRLVRPSLLLDLRRVEDLRPLHTDDDLVMGAMVRQRDVELNARVRERWPLLTAALEHIAYPTIRNVGTIGGSLAHADPAAELSVAMVTLDAQFEVASRHSSRWISVEDFFVSYFTTAIQPNEVLVRIQLPAAPPRAGWGFHEVARRQGDFALVVVACLLALNERGHVDRARIVIGGCAPTPVRAKAAESVLTGVALSESTLREAARLLEADLEPETDIHASAQYRRWVAGALARRAIVDAYARGQQQLEGDR